ncbi:hypothetical protein QT970_27240 [Microcoleus sp. herbarium8]|uniref:hypothetical protein n=1 Tax=Microcoleus sp. herbarium8 TaxID=3055436 RepID=UPI002FD15759
MPEKGDRAKPLHSLGSASLHRTRRPDWKDSKKTLLKSLDTFGRVGYIDGRVRSEPEKAPRRNTASRRCFFCGKTFLRL